MTDETCLTVAALTDYLQYKFTADPYLKEVIVEGEVTNFKLGTKHKYFKLKDENEEKQISITMFSWQFQHVNFPVENGMKVRITGKVELYAPNGTYSLVAQSMHLAGEGELHQKFLEIQQRLEKEGLFQFQKKAIPKFPKKIAVITSETGAVIHDIIRVVNERYPLAEIVLFPAQVQGQAAPSSLEHQLQVLQSQKEEFDVAIVGRGGGSYEELFCFNDEAVVRAAARLSVPLITSVGHQVDLTLIDEVADYSASTPTAAATKATPDRQELLLYIQQLRQAMQRALMYQLQTQTQKLQQLQQASVFTQAQHLYQKQEEQLYYLQQRLYAAMQNSYQKNVHLLQTYQKSLNVQVLEQQVATAHLHLQKAQQSLLHAWQKALVNKQNQLEKDKTHLQALNPTAILQRGYAFVQAQKNWISSIQQVQVGQSLQVHLKDGIVKVKVETIEEEEK